MVEADPTSVADYHYISHEKNESYNSEAGPEEWQEHRYILQGENESYNDEANLTSGEDTTTFHTKKRIL